MPARTEQIVDAVGDRQAPTPRRGSTSGNRRAPFVLAAALTVFSTSGGAQEARRSVDLAFKDVGLSIGDSRTITGLRLNVRDTRLVRVTGINITVLRPGPASAGRVSGYAIGLPMAGANHFMGTTVALIGIDARETMSGISLAGIGSRVGKCASGIHVAGVGLGGGGDVNGIAVGGVGVSVGGMLRGLAVGGVGVRASAMEGIVVGVAGVGGKHLQGAFLSALTVRVSEGGTVQGLSASAFNDGRRGTQRGLVIGVLNIADRLQGVQVGLVNIARNNPAGRRVLPFLNWSLDGKHD